MCELRKSIGEKNPAEIVFRREIAPKFSNLNELHPSKLNATSTIDLKLLTFMKVIGLRGNAMLTSKDVTSAEPVERKKNGDLPVAVGNYASIGSGITFRVSLSRPLLEKKVLPPVTSESYPLYLQIIKKVSDYILKKSIPEAELRKEQVQRVRESFMIEIQESVSLLAIEYKNASSTAIMELFD